MNLTNLTSNKKRNVLFNINQPVTILLREFDDEWWSLVSNVWTQFNYKIHNNGNSWKVYTCRFTKHNESSTRKEGIPSEKR